MILLNELLNKDKRFTLEAYLLINDGLQYAYKMTGRKERINAFDLLEGIRRLMTERYGMLAKTVLNTWGIFTTDDIGRVVFNLYEAGLMVKTNTSRQEDFHAVYDFDQTFIKDYAINDTTIP
ncbi:MAG: Minf_1886 family protein [bacterium]